MSELLQRIQREIHDRAQASRAAVQEYRRLEAALAALDGVAGGAPRAARAQPPSAAERGPAARPKPRAAKRAPRGANRAAVLRAVGDRPGVGVSELAAAAGVKKPVLYTLLSRLTDEGALVKQALP